MVQNPRSQTFCRGLTLSLVLVSLSCSQAKRAAARERDGGGHEEKVHNQGWTICLTACSGHPQAPHFPIFPTAWGRWGPGSNPGCPSPDLTARQHWSLNTKVFTLCSQNAQQAQGPELLGQQEPLPSHHSILQCLEHLCPGVL